MKTKDFVQMAALSPFILVFFISAALIGLTLDPNLTVFDKKK